MYVRQHYNLATTGKLGQKASGKSVAKGGKTASSKSRSTQKSGSYGSKMKNGS